MRSNDETEFEKVLTTIVQDSDFRKRFESDPERVLNDFRLTTAQKTALLALNVAVFLALMGQAAVAKPI
jgi:hypothetical protein